MFFGLLVINEFTVHMPDYTVHVSWTMHQALDLKNLLKKKKKNKNQPDADMGSTKHASQMHP